MTRSPSHRDTARPARDRRDDRDYYRSRDRSRERDVRYRRSRSPTRPSDLITGQRYGGRDGGRDDHRRRRSVDRYDDRRRGSSDRAAERRGPARERSRERRRSREASPAPVRDGRSTRDIRDVRDRRTERVRPRDDRDYDDRDSKRYRRDAPSSPPPRRDENRDRGSARPSSARSEKDSRPSTANEGAWTEKKSVQEKWAAENKEKVAEAKLADDRKAKLAKLEAWKKNLAAKKAQDAASSDAASPQDSTAAASSAVNSPTTTAPHTPAPLIDGKSTSPAPNTGKFDHKAIAKRASEKMAQLKAAAALGGDVVIPKSANDTSNMSNSTLADNRKVVPPNFANGGAKPAPRGSKFTGFGLNKTAIEKQDMSSTTKTAAPLDDDDNGGVRKFRELQDVPVQTDSEDTALANVASDQDDEGDDLRSDEEEAEAIREAAQKRAEEAQAAQQDVAMANGEETVPTKAEPATIKMEHDTNMEEDAEIDPLDAFMNILEKPEDNDMVDLAVDKRKQARIFDGEDDDEVDLEAVDGNANTNDLLAIAAKSKKKEIPPVDHSKIEYEPFRKNFYSESPELAEMTDEELEVLRVDLENIKCRGVDVPKPIINWAQGGFGAQILNVIRDQKFEKPTPIQSQALPAIMSGRDVIGVAKTGSGKTLAFILPMFRHIKDQRRIENLEGPVGLILAPTRELAVQIHRECGPYLRALSLRAVCTYGGSPIKEQIAELRRGAEIVVATPGRFIDLLAANSGRVTNLQRVTYVVLDEADRMFDMGFEPQIGKILKNIRPTAQTVLFSATFPMTMEALARKALKKPIEITVGGRSVVADSITQIIEVREEKSKFKRLLELLGNLHSKDDDARSLIFMEKQEGCDAMVKALLNKLYSSVTVHGGVPQDERDTTIEDFKKGAHSILIATSVAARGLDVEKLKLVVNFDCPNHIEDYVHRAGRTGRAGNTGTAVTFVTPEQDRYAPFLIKALTASKQEIPDDLQTLKEEHDEKVKTGQAKKISKGFGGRGIDRLDAVRDSENAAVKKRYKADDEPDEEEDKDGKKKDAKESAVDKLVAKAIGSVKATDAPPSPTEQDAPLPTLLSTHLNNALQVQKTERPAPATGARSNDPLAKVNAAAASINSRLSTKGGTAGSGRPADNRGPDAGAFHATLEVNDFPQKARWAVTNRTNVAKILDATGTSITNKGNFYTQGREPGPGDAPKLYILVEGDTEVQVKNAMTELVRSLREGTIHAMNEEARAPASGRYSVV